MFANGITTKVLGTSFTVKAFEQDKNVIVSVSTGRVSVYNESRKKDAIILTPNHQITYNKKKESISRGIMEAPKALLETEEVEPGCD